MAYSTVQDVRMIMTNLPSRLEDTKIEAHIEKADAIIDAILGEVYVVPFENVPVLIQKISTDLAIFFLAESLYSSNSPNLDEYQETRYHRSIKMLGEIVDGTYALGVDVPKRSSSSGKFGSTTDGTENLFSYDKPKW